MSMLWKVYARVNHNVVFVVLISGVEGDYGLDSVFNKERFISVFIIDGC